MDIDNYIAIVAAIIAFASVIAMIVQIRAEIKLNRKNQTFNKIGELDKLMYTPNSLTFIIDKVGLLEDTMEPIELKSAFILFENNKNNIFELLNFFESLSLSVFSKNIDEKILRKNYGVRIHKYYIKLNPFIRLIADKYRDPNMEPYQYFRELYDKWDKFYGGKK